MNSELNSASSHVCEEPESSCSRRERCVQMRWLLGGTIFGLLFPMVGWLIAAATSPADTLRGVHSNQPVLYVVDLAPLILGATGYGLGIFHSRLIRTRHSIEETVRARTAELQNALETVAEAQEDKNRFVASVSHELRTPLTSVVGLAHALAEADQTYTAAEEHEFLDLIVRESEEVAAIVEDLLVTARSESGELSLGAESVCLSNELCAVAELVGVKAQTADLDPVVVTGDPVRIRQIIRNLLTNADRYGGDEVTAAVRATDGWAILSVGDNGAGVPADKLDVIFSAFGRAHRRTGRTDSVGLGLTVSRQLARLMGGDVTYHRKPSWTSFELRIPITTADSGQSDLRDCPPPPCQQVQPDPREVATHATV